MGLYNIVNQAALQAGQPEDISQVLANLQAIQAILNGGIDNSNVNAAAAILASKLAGYPASAASVLAGDGTWKTVPKTTTSTFAGGPPGGPVDGDIWIATAVDAANTRWSFTYNAANARWQFIGGNPVIIADSSGFAITNTGAVINVSRTSTTFARAGSYQTVGGNYYGNCSGAGSGSFFFGVGIAGVLQATLGETTVAAGFNFCTGADPQGLTITAGQAINAMIGANQTGSGGVCGFGILPNYVT